MRYPRIPKRIDRVTRSSVYGGEFLHARMIGRYTAERHVPDGCTRLLTQHAGTKLSGYATSPTITTTVAQNATPGFLRLLLITTLYGPALSKTAPSTGRIRGVFQPPIARRGS